MSRDRLAAQFDDEERDQVPGGDAVYGVRAPGIGLPRRTPDNALVPVDAGEADGYVTHRMGRFEITRVGVDLPDDMTHEEWVMMGDVLAPVASATGWIIGDWARYAMGKWGLSYEDIAEQFDLEIGTLYNYVSTCDSFLISLRNTEVYFSHHRAVQGMETRWRNHWLERAATEGWTVAQLKAAIKKAQKTDPADRPTLFSDPALKRGNRLFPKADEVDVREKMTFLGRLKDGAREADPGTKLQIRELAEQLRRFLDDVERMIGE